VNALALTELLHTKAFKLISRQDLLLSAKQLIKRPNSALLEMNTVLSILFDFTLFHYLPYIKKSALTQLLHQKNLSEIEKCLIKKMQKPAFSLMLVREKKANSLLRVEDILLNEEKFLIDKGISQTLPINSLIITTTLEFGDYVITTGAPLPIVEWQPLITNLHKQHDFQEKKFIDFSYKQKTNLIIWVLSQILETNILKSVKYQ
jgi:hypothetical protein